MPSEIISEQRATSNRNGGRDHPGIPGDFRRNQHMGQPDAWRMIRKRAAAAGIADWADHPLSVRSLQEFQADDQQRLPL